ncbi:protein TolR [Benzoatithermus flavus]|uniref:Protein TolR n=1 Tax=Benzoatithermus flavus TaxID=3108223 RepID=A0ABU8XVA7_9PROT
MGAKVQPKIPDDVDEGRRRRRRRARGAMVEINMTPLVDVMLVLLIVFMITAPMLTSGVAVDLPEAASSPLPGQDEPLSVTVDAKGKIYLQESEIALDQLAPRLQAITGRKPDARIFVRGDKGIDYGTVMSVVGAINQAGFNKVALLTEAPSGRAARTASTASPAR